jgi:hypothetical protein
MACAGEVPRMGDRAQVEVHQWKRFAIIGGVFKPQNVPLRDGFGIQPVRADFFRRALFIVPVARQGGEALFLIKRYGNRDGAAIQDLAAPERHEALTGLGPVIFIDHVLTP